MDGSNFDDLTRRFAGSRREFLKALADVAGRALLGAPETAKWLENVCGRLSIPAAHGKQVYDSFVQTVYSLRIGRRTFHSPDQPRGKVQESPSFSVNDVPSSLMQTISPWTM